MWTSLCLFNSPISILLLYCFIITPTLAWNFGILLVYFLHAWSRSFLLIPERTDSKMNIITSTIFRFLCLCFAWVFHWGLIHLDIVIYKYLCKKLYLVSVPLINNKMYSERILNIFRTYYLPYFAIFYYVPTSNCTDYIYLAIIVI